LSFAGLLITNLEGAIKLGLNDDQTKYALAASYYNRDEFDKCVPILMALVLSGSAPSGARELLVRSWPPLGVNSLNEVSDLLQQRSTFPQPLQDEISLGCARYCEEHPGSYADSVAVIEHANKLEPRNVIQIKALLEAMVAEQNWVQGRVYGARLPLEVHSPESIALYARCLCNAMDISRESVEVYCQYLRLHPQDSDVRLRCAQAYISQKQLDDADAILRMGIDE
jgi:hypothetical protein